MVVQPHIRGQPAPDVRHLAEHDHLDLVAPAHEHVAPGRQVLRRRGGRGAARCPACCSRPVGASGDAVGGVSSVVVMTTSHRARDEEALNAR